MKVLRLLGLMVLATASIGADGDLGCLLWPAVLLVWLLPVDYVVMDARRRGVSSVAWGLAVCIFWLPGLLVYLVARPQGKLIKCWQCGRKKPIRDMICPHCGTQVA